METFGIHVYKEYFNFAAAHFLVFEDGTREELHGHNYHVQVRVEGSLQGDQDVFIDFLHIKPIVKAICDSIDHLTLIPERNPHLTVTRHGDEVELTYDQGGRWIFPKRDVKILPIANTSAERLGQYLCQQTLAQLADQYPDAVIQLIEFTVEETPGQSAIYRQAFEKPQTLRTLAMADHLVTV